MRATTGFTLFFLIVLSACVSQKKYNELLAEKVKLEADKLECQDHASLLEDKAASLEKELDKATAARDSLANLSQSQSDHVDSLQAQYDALNNHYENLLSNSGKLNQDLESKRRELESAQANLDLEQKKNEALKKDLDAREARVSELENVLKQKEAAVQHLKDIVSDALLSFKKNDLSVEVKNGKVYVSLAEQLLFATGSITVDPKGAKALQQLAKVLKENPDVNIMVEGHTDNVPVHTNSPYMKDNWDLSVLRATSITKILTKHGVKPARIIASGRAEFVPKASNDTAEGRRENRRTEIILTPKLDELFQILDNN